MATTASAPVDISTIEAAKENILPLASGRSASQLASLSSSTRSGLGSKLAQEHKKFDAQIAAIDYYENTGEWPPPPSSSSSSSSSPTSSVNSTPPIDSLKLSLEEVERMAEDPLDVHHQYARFVISNYPAGASAANKLVPLLEKSTRRFLQDERYRNDPRYLRLWNLYAKHIDCPEDCYKFLFAKGVGERLAMLYEEYAAVLEQAGRRTQADQVYSLGINRSAAPLDRLKKRYTEFTARMLIAPPVASPPRANPSTSTDPTINPHARPALSGRGFTAGAKENQSASSTNGASAFAIFRDTTPSSSSTLENSGGSEWKDLGTVASRKRENEMEAKGWKGETMPMGGEKAQTVAPIKLTVFRDADAPATLTSHLQDPTIDVFGRSMRGPSEAEQLRKNPFKNYSSADSHLSTIDPLDGLVVIAPPKPRVKASSISGSSSTSSTKVAAPSTASASNTSAAPSSSKTTKGKKEPAPKPTSEKVACDLRAIYPDSKSEFSFEELMMKKRGGKVMGWIGWEWAEAWSEEMMRRGDKSFERDLGTGYPRLYDLKTHAPLYDLLPRPVEATVVSPVQSPARLPSSDSTLQLSTITLADVPSTQSEPVRLVSSISLSPPVSRQVVTSSPTSVPLRDSSSTPDRSDSSSPVDTRRQPSPTINTREAQAMIDGLFAKTLNFNDRAQPRTNENSDSGSDSEPSTEDSDVENDRAAWADLPVSQLDLAMSQFTSQGATSQSSTVSEMEAPFVPFSQTASQTQDSLFGPSQFSQLEELREQSESSERVTSLGLMGYGGGDENEGIVVAKPRPMQLFRDALPTHQAGLNDRPIPMSFKPSRAPFGEKSALTFAIHKDEQPQGVFAAHDNGAIPSSQPDERVDESFEDFEAPLAQGFDTDDEGSVGSDRIGVSLGRRPAGVPNRYAPFIHAMTPITERTGEYTAFSSLSTSQRSRRDSAFPATVEEDEDETDSEPSTEDDEEEEEEGEVANQAFEGFLGGAAQPEEEDDSTSNSSRTTSSEDEEEQMAPSRQVSMAPSLFEVPVEAPQEWRRTSLVGKETNLPKTSSGRPSTENSYDASVNTSLPEGLALTGNRTGMTTGKVVDSTTRSSLVSTSSLAPIDPWSDAAIAQAVAAADPPILSHPNVRDRTTLSIKNLLQLQKAAKKREGKNKSKDRTGTFDEVWEFRLDDQTYPVRAKLGEGAFGSVFRVAMPTASDDDPDASFDYDAEETTMAVKIERPTNLWEFHILDRLHSRLDERVRRSVVAASRLDAYADESYLFLDVCTQGSLLDAVNNANELGIAPATGGVAQGVDEILAMFFVVELLRTLEGFHRAGFVHGDLKIDNCLVRLEDVPNPARNWSSRFDRTGAGAWNAKGLKLIDFGRTLDLSTYPEGQTFICSFQADQGDCLEMREREAWTFEPDYFGAAGIAFTLLFGKPIETRLVGGEGTKRQVIDQPFRRYHQVDLWTQMFEALLNPRLVKGLGGRLPITEEVGRIRGLMEDWLEMNSEKNGKSLKKMIKDIMKASLQ
ncbi:BQ5605_C009g05496 [Microbotryum silenes-dioicae]|uniref:BQ5605_C009g05496 protein n=1 Tax=Microbotryum silenes-dioicae TaxID=796604 RepID=A0A2X0N0A0_9BASI|nr:BQ5605_C009g05496 [Microbotryum silenes-dioicae]